MSALKDVIGWLGEGCVVVLYSIHRSRTFYKERPDTETKVYYTCVPDPLLNEGEWEYYIKLEGYQEGALGFMPSNVENYKLYN